MTCFSEKFYLSLRSKIIKHNIDYTIDRSFYIKDIDMSYFRSQIGYVQQEPMMFSDTIYQNIAYGNPDMSEEIVVDADENGIADNESYIHIVRRIKRR